MSKRGKGRTGKAALFAEVECYNQLGDREDDMLDALEAEYTNQFAEQERRMRAEEPRLELKMESKPPAQRTKDPKPVKKNRDEDYVSDPESLDDPELRGSGKAQEILAPVAKITPKQAGNLRVAQGFVAPREDPRLAATMKAEPRKEIEDRRAIVSEAKDRSKGEVKLPPLRQTPGALPKGAPGLARPEEAKVSSAKNRAGMPLRPPSKDRREEQPRVGSKEAAALLLRKDKAPMAEPEIDFLKEMVHMNKEEQRRQNELLSLSRGKVRDVEQRQHNQRSGNHINRAPAGPPQVDDEDELERSLERLDELLAVKRTHANFSSQREFYPKHDPNFAVAPASTAPLGHFPAMQKPVGQKAPMNIADQYQIGQRPIAQASEPRNVIQVRQYRGAEEEENQEDDEEEEYIPRRVVESPPKPVQPQVVNISIVKDFGYAKTMLATEQKYEPPLSEIGEEEQLSKKEGKGVSGYKGLRAQKQTVSVTKGKKEKEAREGPGDEEATAEGKIRMNTNVDFHKLLFD